MEYNARGLTNDEALQGLRQYGFNEIKDFSGLAPFKILLRLIKTNFIIYLLLVGAGISFFVGESITGVTILLVLAVIVFVTFIQEYRAEKSIQALKSMITQTSIAFRNGKEEEVLSKELVPGDIIILRTGERIPADCVVIEESNLFANESILTGESREVQKKATEDFKNYSDENSLFMGSFVAAGRCKALVVHTGMNTRFGGIAGMISEAEKSLPLQEKVNKLARYMVVVAIAVSLLTGLLMATRVDILTPEAISGILVLMIALSVSAFPEGLPVVLVTTLAVGATRMAKKNAIVNRMSIIETLGETTVICTDKTGTLTRGEMTVKKIIEGKRVVDVGGVGFEARGDFMVNEKEVDLRQDKTLELLFQAAVLCNDSRIEKTGEDEEYKVQGTPTEGALLIMAAKAGIFLEDLPAQRIEEVPFNSDRKMMSVLCKLGDKNYVFAKGALEVLLDKCSHIQTSDKVSSFDSKEKADIEKANGELAKDSYRTIALAYKELDSGDRNYTEDDLVFLGTLGIDDPPREEVAESLRICRQAGIAVKMMTGDNKETALAIAKQIGLLGDVLEGVELDKLTDDELSKVIKSTVIFTRVRPEHKLRIVRILKQLGEIVTMTGDGVNDAPALKEAHIGVAMGKNGTDVSRSVADLTLKDDNFATIVEAVREGRTIFNNIRKFVSYQLSCNWAELMILLLGVIFAPLLGWQVPVLLALQILFMNLVTDDLPAITLGLNSSSRDVMGEAPRRKAEILSKEAITLMSLAAICMTFFTLLTFYISFNIFQNDLSVARTTAMLTLILLEIAGAFNFRSFRRPSLTRSPFVNIYLFWASLISIAATIFVIYSPLNKAFGTTFVGISEWGLAILVSLLFAFIFDRWKSMAQRSEASLPTNVSLSTVRE